VYLLHWPDDTGIPMEEDCLDDRDLIAWCGEEGALPACVCRTAHSGLSTIWSRSDPPSRDDPPRAPALGERAGPLDPCRRRR